MGCVFMDVKRKFGFIAFLLFTVITTGVVGYILLLDLSFIDALYMTVITISTVGYKEVGNMTPEAKIFTIGIIFSGLAVFGYVITSMVALFFEGELRDAWRERTMNLKLDQLNGHYIVCGAGNVGRTVINIFNDSKINFVVIEENENTVEELKELGILTIRGNATHEDVLGKAAITKAKGIICSLATDAENVFTVLTARQMNDDIFIVSKAIEKSAHNKLTKAGANKTISPNEIGGQRMAALLLRPSVISFLDVITRDGDVTLDLEEIKIPHYSNLVGKKLMDAKIPEKTGLIVLALKKTGAPSFKFNPNSRESLDNGDIIVVLGTHEQIDALNALVHIRVK